MNNKVLKTIDDLFLKPTILIVDNTYVISKIELDYLLSLNFEHLYFVRPSDKTIEYLETVTDDTFFTKIDNFQQIENVKNYNIIASGLKPLPNDFKKTIKNTTRNIVIFYNQTVKLFGNFWNEFNNKVIIIEQSIEDFIKQNFSQEVKYSPEILPNTDYFINRKSEIDKHREILIQKNIRIIEIVGMVGIGKRSLINELKTNYGLNTNCIEFTFYEKFDNLKDIISSLYEKLGLSYSQDEISDIYLKPNFIPKQIQKIFTQFDSIENCKLIFNNVNEVFDFKQRKFYNPEIELFFTYLISRDTYRLNKIYIISNREIIFNDEQINNNIQIITLPYLKPHYIKLIIAREFSDRQQNELAHSIMQIEDNVIHDLLGGHPQISKLFVRASEVVGMESIINDKDFRKDFEENYKLKYLIEKLKLSDYEINLLNHLALFKSNFNSEYLKRLDKNPLNAVFELKKQFLLETVHLKNGTTTYFIPTLIQNYIKSGIDYKTLANNHSLIGDFYWEQAEIFTNTKIEDLENYRLALYHYTQAGNKEKENQLILRFKEKFIEKALILYREGYYKSAYEYYNEIYNNNSLYDIHLNYYLICCGYCGIPNTNELYEISILTYPKNIYIKTSYCKFLLSKNHYDKCEKILKEVLLQKNNHYPAIALQAQLYYHTNMKEEAILILNNWILKLKSIENKSNADINGIIILNISLYQITENEINKLNLILNVKKMLIKENVSELNYFYLVNKLIDIKKINEIESLFMLLFKQPFFNKSFFNLYKNFLIDQGDNLDIEHSLLQEISNIKENKKENKKSIEYITSNAYKRNIELHIQNNIKDIEDKMNSPKQVVDFILNEEDVKSKFKNFSSDEIRLFVDNFEIELSKCEQILNEILFYDKNNTNAISYNINLLTLKNTLFNLKAIIALSYNSENKNCKKTIFVEGLTDKTLISKALSLFQTSKFDFEILTDHNAGTNWVHDEALSWVLRREKDKGIAIVILDDDESGRDIKSKLQQNDKFKNAEKESLIKILLLPKPQHISAFYKQGIIKKRSEGEGVSDFPFSIEHLFPETLWVYAKEKNWLEEIENIKLIPTGPRISAYDFCLSKGFSDNNLLYLFYKFKMGTKKKFADYVTSLEGDDLKSAFCNFEVLVTSIESTTVKSLQKYFKEIENSKEGD